MLVISVKQGRKVYLGDNMDLHVLQCFQDHVVGIARVPVAVDVHVGGPDPHLAALKEHLDRTWGGRTPAATTERKAELFGLPVGHYLRIGADVIVWLKQVSFERVMDGESRVFGLPQARLVFDAPRWLAISRDEITFARHLEFQRAREALPGTTGDPK